MTLSAADAQAIASTAQALGVDPKTLGALMELESGLDPNVWGGAGGKYRGLIQFGPGARKEVGLPDRPMSIAEQMPYVAKYFQQRGFTPGKHGPVELYRTVLVGNPHQSGTDSFGTNSDSAAKRMLPGGDLYERFSSKFTGQEQGLSLSGAGLEEAAKPRTGDPLGAVARVMAASPGFMAKLQKVDPGTAAQVAAVTAFLPKAIPGAGGREMAPVQRMSAGGGEGGFDVIEYLTGDPSHGRYRADHGGSNYHEHLAFSTKEQRDAAMQKLKAAGIQIGSVNDGKHAPGSYHYKDLAFDVPAAQVPVGQEQELSRRVREILGMS